MPQIDLGSVVGPQGPQGSTGPQGQQGVQGIAGPNQVTAATSTTFGTVSAPVLLTGNGSKVGSAAIDTELSSSSARVPSSFAVWKRVSGMYSHSYTTGSAAFLRIPSTETAVYLVVINRRYSSDRAPYVAVVTYYDGNASIQQLTNNTVTMTVLVTSSGGTDTGIKIGIPSYSSGFVISDCNFSLNVSES